MRSITKSFNCLGDRRQRNSAHHLALGSRPRLSSTASRSRCLHLSHARVSRILGKQSHGAGPPGIANTLPTAGRRLPQLVKAEQCTYLEAFSVGGNGSGSGFYEPSSEARYTFGFYDDYTIAKRKLRTRRKAE